MVYLTGKIILMLNDEDWQYLEKGQRIDKQFITIVPPSRFEINRKANRGKQNERPK